MSVLARAAPTPLAESLERLETLVSPYTGIVRAVESPLAATDDARFVTVYCDLADTRVLLGSAIDANAISWGTSGDQARAAALGEAAERYSAGFVPTEELVLATAAELGDEAVDPERFALFHRRQYDASGFPYRPFARDTRVRWVEGFEISSGERAFVPAQLVYMGGCQHVPGEAPIAYATSNGLACRPTMPEALVSGLLEVLERDAFAITWYSRLAQPRLEVDRDGAAAVVRDRYVRRTGLRWTALDLSVFHDLPTVLACVHGGRRDRVALSVGAAAAATPEEAWTKAIAEAFGSRAWARHLRRTTPAPAFGANFVGVTDFDDHVLLYAFRRHARRARFLTASTSSRPLSDVPALEGSSLEERGAALLDRVARAGAAAYAVDVTAPDIAAAGLRVAKVIVPELCQLDVLHSARYLGGRRLATAAFEHGLRQAPLRWEEINPFPHPFP